VHSEADDRFDGPVTVDLLADLQAGLLDDQTAARLRQRARTEPNIAGQLAALDRVRRDVAALGVGSSSAPAIPADVTAQIGTALRSEPPPASAQPSQSRHVAAAAGVAALIAAGAVGTAMLLGGGSAGDVASAPSSVATPRVSGGLPLSEGQIAALLRQPPALGELADPRRRVSCLSGLGYPTSTAVLGGKPLLVDGVPAVLMLLPGDVPGRINAVVVAPECSAVDTGLVVSSVVSRP
jgi:hypothetical protein